MKKTEDKNGIIAEAIYDLSKSIRSLGNGNIDQEDFSFGNIEGLAFLISDSNQEIASSIGGISSTFETVAEAISEVASSIEILAEAQGCKCQTEKTKVESNEYKN
jgi:hypothetical protein